MNHKRKRPKSQRGMGRAMGQKLWKQNGEKRSAESRTMQERRADPAPFIYANHVYGLPYA